MLDIHRHPRQGEAAIQEPSFGKRCSYREVQSLDCGREIAGEGKRRAVGQTKEQAPGRNQKDRISTSSQVFLAFQNG
jgi:hypothetical protein